MPETSRGSGSTGASAQKGRSPASPRIASNAEIAARDQKSSSFFDVLPSDMSDLEEQLRRVAPQDSTLLFTGETGTGKTRLAHLVHELSPRRTEPFQVMDCGALSASLIESEMFGHVKGAFTGADRDRPGQLAAVGRGTLLL